MPAAIVTHAAVVWLDHWHALVARRNERGTAVLELDRGAESEDEFILRVSAHTDDCDRLMILGPGDDALARVRFTLGHHGARAASLDIEACAAASPNELFDRLRLLEGDAGAGPAG